MKSATIALSVMLLLSGCGQELTETPVQGKILIQPDVPNYPRKLQNQIADEIQGGSCPLLSDVIATDNLISRDQSRIVKKELK